MQLLISNEIKYMKKRAVVLLYIKQKNTVSFTLQKSFHCTPQIRLAGLAKIIFK